METSEANASVEITQQNINGPGRIASRALGLAAWVMVIVLFVLAISVALIQRWISGDGAPEEIIATFLLLLPLALVLTVLAMIELAIALPRRLSIDKNGILVRFSTWPLPRPTFLGRHSGEQARAVRRRHKNYATYPSGQTSYAPIVSEQTMIQYGTGWFGPVDADQAESLVAAINAALVRTEPVEE